MTEINLGRVTLPKDHLLVKEIPPEQASPGGIIIPDASQKDRAVATVVKLGKMKGEPFTPSDNPVSEMKPGDEVLTSKYAMLSAIAYELGEGLHIISIDDVLCVIKPEKKIK